MISDYILDETLTLLRTRFGYVWAERFWNLFRQACDTGYISLLKVDENLWQNAIQIFFQYQDQDFPSPTPPVLRSCVVRG